jgi:UTP--glucose-1-phosphate uridylyltransferase
MSKIRKAIIPVAGMGTRQFPASHVIPKGLFPVVDRDGFSKPLIQRTIEGLLASGIEQVALVTGPGGGDLYRRHFAEPSAELQAALSRRPDTAQQVDMLARVRSRLSFIEQPTPEGYGHAVWCAREWAAGEPVMVVLGDYMFVSDEERPCAAQLLDAFDRLPGAVSAVRPQPESVLRCNAAQACEPTEHDDVYRVLRIVEKPDVELARRELTTPGLPDGTFMCQFGLHAFTPGIFDSLQEMVDGGIHQADGEIQLTAAQERLRPRGPYHAVVVHGRYFDFGIPRGIVAAHLALAAAEAAWQMPPRQ